MGTFNMLLRSPFKKRFHKYEQEGNILKQIRMTAVITPVRLRALKEIQIRSPCNAASLLKESLMTTLLPSLKSTR